MLELHRRELRVGAVHLRAWTPDDYPVIVEACHDKTLRSFCGFLSPELPAFTRMLEGQQRTWTAAKRLDLAITVDGKVVGGIGYRDYDPAYLLADMFVWTLPTSRDKGIASAATRALLNWTYGTYRLNHVTMTIPHDHRQALEWAETFGFGTGSDSRCPTDDGYVRMHIAIV